VKRCAIYARYSSDLQSPHSIDDQFRLCRAYAERREWTVVATYQDAALSGFGVEHRPGYQQLLAAALNAPPTFEIILVEDLSRLTRDTSELLRLYHRVRLKGIELVGVSDGIATAQQGAKVQLTVKGLVNELYLDDLREKTHRGLVGRVIRGWSAGGRIFGYRTTPVQDGVEAGRTAPARFVIEPGEAARASRSLAKRHDVAPSAAGGRARQSASSCATKSMPESGSGISAASSRIPRPGGAARSRGRRRSGCARSMPIFGSSTPRCGKRFRSGSATSRTSTASR